MMNPFLGMNMMDSTMETDHEQLFIDRDVRLRKKSGQQPGKQVKIDRPDNERKRYLTEEESGSLLSALRAKSEQLWQISLVSLDTGARFSEIARLTWGHVDIDGGLITYADTKKAGGTKSRTVPMTSRLKGLFQSIPSRGSNGDLVFPGANGKQLTKISNTFPKMVKSTSKTVEVVYVGTHEQAPY